MAKNIPEADIMEEYTPFGHTDYQTIIGKIKKFAGEGNDRGDFDHQRRFERSFLQRAR